MYARDAKAIQAYVRREGPDGFANVALFVLATIRVPLWSACAATKAILASKGADRRVFRRVIWGRKTDGLAYLTEHAESIYHECLAASSDVELMDILTAIPGLGLAKAGFLAQLAFGRVGCLDTHNLKRFNLDKEMYRIDDDMSPEIRLARCRAYCEAVGECGGTETLWDSWCEFIAETQPKRYENPYHVSALHVAALNLEEE